VEEAPSVIPPRSDELSVRREVARRRRFPQLVAAAAAVVTLGVGATVLHPWSDDSSQSVSAADQVLTAPDRISKQQQIGGATTTLVSSASVGKAVLVAKDLPPAPSGKVYELWLQNAQGKVSSAGLLTGSGDQTFVLKGDASAAVWAGMTIEPKGGSEVPTMPTIAAFDIAGPA
jgi:anti-sigma-K factor RskA